MTICRTGQLVGATWAEDDTIYFAYEDSPVILRVSASGGEPQPFTELRDEEVLHRWPSALPGARAVLFVARSDGEDWFQARIDVQNVESGERHSVLEGGTSPRFVEP